MDKYFLNELRMETDPFADKTVKYLIENNQLDTVNKILFSLGRNDSVVNEAVPQLKEYLNQTAQLPSWADPNKIKKAQDLYAIYGLEISLILFCKSLPQSYCCPKGAKVLHSTGRLSKDASFNKYTRRVMETSQFVMNVLSPKGFDKEGSAIITIQKVRLLHASIRYYLKKHRWDSVENGEPINQQDMMGTLISFSALVIEGLEMINITWTEEEKDAFTHCWNVVGYILGVKPELLPQNYEEALSVGYLIFDDQKGHSQEGKELAEALISFIHYTIPGNLFDGMAENIIGFFLGPENTKILGLNIEDELIQQKLAVICKLVGASTDELKDNSQLIKAIVKPFSKMILNGILLSYTDHKGPAILIPPSLKENWKLHTGWENTVTGPDFLGRRIVIQRKINTLG